MFIFCWNDLKKLYMSGFLKWRGFCIIGVDSSIIVCDIEKGEFKICLRELYVNYG